MIYIICFSIYILCTPAERAGFHKTAGFCSHRRTGMGAPRGKKRRARPRTADPTAIKHTGFPPQDEYSPSNLVGISLDTGQTVFYR